MKHAKRIITILVICILTLSAVFISYIGIENGAVVFAEDVHFMTDRELESAYQAYLQSKGGGLIGNVGARYTYTTGKLLNFITSDSNTTGITTIDELKSQMTWQKQYLENGNGYLSLGITNRGMGLLNLYTQYLMQQHFFGNGVEEGENGLFDEGIDNTLYSGELFVDDNGNACFVTVYKYYSNYSYYQVTKMGTKFIKDGGIDAYNFFVSKGSPQSGFINYTDFIVNGNTYHHTITKCSGSSYNISLTYNNKCYYYYEWGDKKYSGIPTIAREEGSSTLYTAVAMYNPYYRDNICETRDRISNKSAESVNINFYTNNNNNISVYPTINEGDTLYITPKLNVGVDGEVNYQPYIINEGDNITNIVNNYYTDSGTKDKTITVPSDDPAGGVGGGGSSDGPIGGNPPNWSNPFPHLSPDGEGGFNFNFQLPDLNIDWNISGLTEKFPFSIPFDFVAFCRVLDAEPETPALQCDIDLKLVTWHVDYDLHQFDDIASLLRNLEFIAFCIALVIMTRNMIKG